MFTLHDGVRRFQREVLPELSDRFAELANGQSPEVLFVTCSDSRIDPSLITQTLPGELFVLRNAGNLVPVHGEDDGSASAVEYAVAALGVKHVVVCGHSGCGAMTGLLKPDAVAALPTVARWVKHAAPSAEATTKEPEDQRLEATICHNAVQQLDNLLTHPSVAQAVREGRLQLHAWVYDIGTGDVETLAVVDDVGGARVSAK